VSGPRRSRRRPPLLAALTALALGIAAASGGGCGGGEGLVIGVASSVQDSGLMDALVDGFKEQHPEIGSVKAVPGGSGQLLEMARRGELDAIITHSPAGEAELVAAGDGIDGRPFMHNFFVLAGPEDDPAGVGRLAKPLSAFKLIAESGAKFVSRGDQSGTHVRELAIWAEAGIDPAGESWYQESGVGQGPNLQVASDKGAYTLADSGTWTALKDDVELVLYLIDAEAANVYSVTRVNPEEHSANQEAARAFADFLTSDEGQALIEEFGVEQYGEPLFIAGDYTSAPAPTP
jgi:tungstate transport system substrate-binding protein